MTDYVSATDWLAGGGAMGELVRSKDWSQTPLGPIEDWPQSLRTTVSLCLASNFPISIAWGPQRTQIYNDGYWPICGDKHPQSMGQDFKECWLSAWPAIGEVFERASAGETRFLVNERMFLDRHGYLEETFFTFSFSPIRDESGGVGGLFHPVTELTQQTLAERRLKVLRDVAEETTEAHTVAEAADRIVRALREHPLDVPFALLYFVDASSPTATLDAACGLEPGTKAAPRTMALDHEPTVWPLGSVARSGRAEQVENLAELFGTGTCGPYAEPPHTAIVMPIQLAGLDHLLALLVAGVSARRALDDSYRTFYVLLGDAVTNALTRAQAYEEEKRRAEELAELDRAKTAFFSNVSHEFRTPLTLMLGPLEDLLNGAGDVASRDDRTQLEIVHRNGLRLLRLVNTLLDFSRIEAGRIEASYEPTDLAAFTTDLASVFRSAIERSGLRLTVDCPTLSGPVHVDREMWEKIVLNLLSNAFKFTFEGEIVVALRESADSVELTVRDTGIGIPAGELPRIFERFRRVRGAQARTHEGSGIGLALLHELAQLHGGEAQVESIEGQGTTFSVVIPKGTAHLPAERISSERRLVSTATGADAFLAEALRWLPGRHTEIDDSIARSANETPARRRTVPSGRECDETVGARVLFVDDNADMRDYVRALLADRYEVVLASDGHAALANAQRQPFDLILSDVMMPGLDGFGLLQRLRTSESTREIPVILLSARAGEEAQIDGLAAGADDYLIKPFSARELLARVESHLRLKRLRERSQNALRESEARFRNLADNAPVMIWMTEADGSCSYLSKSWYEFTGQTPATGLGFGWIDAVHPEDREHARTKLLEANSRHEPVTIEYRVLRQDGEYRWAIDAATPRFGEEGGFLGYIGSVMDITERKAAENTRQLLINELNHRVKNTLASVQAIVQQTLRRTSDPAEFARSFSGRIQSLARVHSLLTSETWQGADLRELIGNQLIGGPVDETQLTLRGPAVRLDAQTTLHLALMLHELGTNALKHGAFSSPAGRVAVTWTVDDDMLRLQWVERGGPAVSAPTTRGFGTTLIERSARSDRGEAHVIFEAEGVSWRIALPLPPAKYAPGSSSSSSVAQTPSRGDTATEELGSSRRRLSGRRILVVEDEPLVALDITSVLEAAGVEVVGPASTAAEALRRIADTSLDAVLLDANLHGRSSAEVKEALERRSIPFVLVTGYDADGLPDAFRDVDSLMKPFSPAELRTTCGRLVAG